MVELTARTPAEGLGLPRSIGHTTLAEVPGVPIASIAPYPGREAAVEAALGQPLPPPGRASADGLVWGGYALTFALGQEAGELAETLAGAAAVTDQSDGWARLALTGADWEAVLARLSPVDPQTLRPGAVARTEMAHIAALLMGVEGGVEIWVMRSFTRSAVHEIEVAMTSLAARATL
ncbi:MAG: sarcosine oxidase subunit gamma [Pseudomonadota bacterium]